MQDLCSAKVELLIVVSDRPAYGFPTARTSFSLLNGMDFIVVIRFWPLSKGQDSPVRGQSPSNVLGLLGTT
jgi:hypothetical protein